MGILPVGHRLETLTAGMMSASRSDNRSSGVAMESVRIYEPLS